MSKQVDYFYHATSFENFRKIISEGFLFDNESKGVYLADDISHSLMFGCYVFKIHASAIDSCILEEDDVNDGFFYPSKINVSYSDVLIEKCDRLNFDMFNFLLEGLDIPQITSNQFCKLIKPV